MTNISCPGVIHLRKTIETHILDLYENDGVTLKPLAEWPGYYTTSANETIPAVYVTGASMVPSDWRITGIECVINDVPEIQTLGIISGISTKEIWTVRFTNYGDDRGTLIPTSLLTISRRVSRAFPRDSFTYMPRTEATFEALTARISGAVLNSPIP